MTTTIKLHGQGGVTDRLRQRTAALGAMRDMVMPEYRDLYWRNVQGVQEVIDDITRAGEVIPPNRDGWIQVICPTCGNCGTVPGDADDKDDRPWCWHADRFVWRAPHRENRDKATRCVLAEVRAAE